NQLRQRSATKTRIGPDYGEFDLNIRSDSQKRARLPKRYRRIALEIVVDDDVQIFPPKNIRVVLDLNGKINRLPIKELMWIVHPRGDMQTSLALLFQGQRTFQVPNILDPCRHLVRVKSVDGVDGIAQHDDDLGRRAKSL